MIRYDQCVGPHIDCSLCVLSCVDTFNDDRSLPRLANPFQIVPGHNRLLKSRSNIGVQHWSFAGDNDILKFHQAAICEKSCQPPRPNEELVYEWQHGPEFSTEQFLCTVSKVSFAVSRDWRVDSDHQSRKTSFTRP